MPELPEVETIRLGLQSKIIGLKIKKIQILEPKSFLGDPNLLIGKTITSIWRRGKVLGINLTDDLSILFHLKMSGQLIFIGKEKVIGGHPTKDMSGDMPIKSTRVIFEFDNPLRPRSEASNLKLYFNDQRKFGWVKIIYKDKLIDDDFFKKLGPEPLDPDFTLQIFKDRLLKRKKTAVKVAILDQTVLAGVGNIYASESLFLAKINPQRLVGSLNNQEIKKLHQSIKDVLNSGIKHGGSSKTHYVNSDGGRGYFLDYAYVYNRAGNVCKICKGIILKSQLGGRGTFFCLKCQR